ncbi:MAG: redoxin domain-containing protein [Planctomycetota bacterium]
MNKKTGCCVACVALAGLLLGVPTVATADDDDAKLTIGDKAPAIEISHWIKGDKVTKFEKDKVYVLEFWATWCGPCVAGMPHLSELQKKYADKDVTIIGVSNEELETVTEFLARKYEKEGKTHNDRTEYTLATDPDKSADKDYMLAANQNGIPTAFIIGKSGKIEWIGHPMVMDDALDAVVKGTWDRKPFKKEFEKQQALEKKLQAFQEQYSKSLKAEDWAAAIKTVDELIALDEGNTRLQVMKFVLIAGKQGEYERAYKYAAMAVEKAWDNGYALNEWAWCIVDDKGLEKRDLDLAMKAATRANELTDGKEAAILDTLARVYYEKGNLKEAIKYQQRAADSLEGNGGPMAEELTKTLDKYKGEADKGEKK